ncbi:MAG TPA: amino acid ABC transporter substrate-binding protein [Chloroflexi bacterium]|nr:amino acid ABC transporter substrate-binding protein [Chloroflexota bacterium]
MSCRVGIWRAVLTGGLVFTLALCLLACTGNEDAWKQELPLETLRVGMDASMPPFEYVAADGSLAGFDVDLARELGRRLDVDVQFVANLSYDGLYDALAVGRVDVVISSLVVDPDRMDDFAYSAHYFDAGQVLVLREGNAEIEGIGDLDAHTVAVEFGAPGDMVARRWARRRANLIVEPYQTADEALRAVADGTVDAAVVDRVSALAVVGAEAHLVIADTPVAEELYAVAMRREDKRLRCAINATLSEMEADGALTALVDEWLRPFD